MNRRGVRRVSFKFPVDAERLCVAVRLLLTRRDLSPERVALSSGGDVRCRMREPIVTTRHACHRCVIVQTLELVAVASEMDGATGSEKRSNEGNGKDRLAERVAWRPSMRAASVSLR